MEWEKDVKELFEKIIAELPWEMEAMIKPLLLEEVQKKCLGRNAGLINQNDLLTALFQITPKPFHGEAQKICDKLGLDWKKYTQLVESQENYQISWEKVGKAFHPGNMHVSCYVTDKCNQNCLHCAAQEKHLRPELPKEDWFKMIDNVENGLRANGRRGVYIWFGGEPTCREDIRDLIAYCGQKGYYQSLITNGVNFTEEFAKFCVDNGMTHFFVSLDSVKPELSDRIRGFKDSLKYAERAMRIGVKYGLFTCCSTTVMKLNIDELQDIKDFVEDIGAQPYFRAIVKQRNAAINWDEVGLTLENYKTLYDFKYKCSIEKMRQGKAGLLPVYEIFEMVPFMEPVKSEEERNAIEWGVGCQACRCFTGVDMNGDIFPCGYPSQLKLGNALVDSYEDVMNSQLFKDIRDKKRTGKCKDCHHVDLCGGGCRLHAECETGSYFEPFPYCWHENDHEHE